MVGVWWEVPVCPAQGDGYLSQFDVDEACGGIPDGSSVELVLSDSDEFGGSAVAVLARRLRQAQVRLRVQESARRAGRRFVLSYGRAHALPAG